MTKSAIALVFGMLGLVVGVTLSNTTTTTAAAGASYGEGDVKGREAIFTKRKIYNEGSARWQYKGGVNPAW